MSSKSIRIKNYKADNLYSELFSGYLKRNFSGIADVLVHHVQTNIDGITHIVSVEMILNSGERVFANIKALSSRTMFYIDIELPNKLIGKIHATW